jgi:hypothetical protein
MTLRKKALKDWKMETPDVWQHFKQTKITLSPIPSSRLQTSYCNPSDKCNLSWNSKKDSGTNELIYHLRVYLARIASHY